MGKIDLRTVVITAMVAMLLTAAFRAIAPKLPLLDRVAAYV